MAVGKTPNVVMLMESLRLDLARINRANDAGFYTDVEAVDWPDYSPLDDDGCLAGNANVIHLWAWTSPQTSARENASDLRPTLEVLVMGVVKRRDGLQEELLKLVTDVRNVMYANVSRDWPDGTVPNVWGITTRQTPGYEIVLRHHDGAEGVRCKSFLSSWQFDYRNPYPSG